MNHAEVLERLEAYALGALDPAERNEVDAHLEHCQSCRSEAEAYRLVADALPGALALATPARRGPVVKPPMLRRLAPRGRWERFALGGFAAAVVVLAATLAWSVQLNQALAQERALYAALAGQQEIVFEVIDFPETTRIVLRPPVAGATSYGKVFTRPDLPYLVAMAGRLPAAPNGEAYHLWITFADGEDVLGGVLMPNRDGFAAVVYEADRNGPQPQAVRLILQDIGAEAPEGVPALLWLP
jgi:hypothetical protein